MFKFFLLTEAHKDEIHSSLFNSGKKAKTNMEERKISGQYVGSPT